MQMGSTNCTDNTKVVTYTINAVTNFLYFNSTSNLTRPLDANYAPVTGPSIAHRRWAGLVQISTSDVGCGWFKLSSRLED